LFINPPTLQNTDRRLRSAVLPMITENDLTRQ
jgi:hypothetical protein